jgi:PEP-CTERM motif
MKISGGVRALTLLAAFGIVGDRVQAAPLITAVVDHGTAPNAPDTNTPIATSAASPSTSGTSAALVDEAFAYTTRTHEWTAAVVDNTTGLLSTTTGNTNGAPSATQTVEPFPSYLKNLEYVQFANNNRNITDYSSDMTFSAPVTAYLFVDNRAGAGGSTVKANTSDPDLTSLLSWITTDGWTRVNTGFMPNGQADYLGIDEGATVANEAARTHTASGNVAGSGFGVNNFAAIYKKNFPAGLNVGVTKATGNSGIDFYGVAVAPVPEPSTLVLAAVGMLGGAFAARRRLS